MVERDEDVRNAPWTAATLPRSVMRSAMESHSTLPTDRPKSIQDHMCL
jgi:hypothetical protein